MHVRTDEVLQTRMQLRLRERWSAPLCNVHLQGEFLHLSRTVAHVKKRQSAAQLNRISAKKSAYTRSSAEKTAVRAQSNPPPPNASPTPLRHTCISSTPGHMASQTDWAANSAGFIGLTEPLSCGSRHNGLCRNISTPFLLQQSEAGGGRARVRQDKGPTVRRCWLIIHLNVATL